MKVDKKDEYFAFQSKLIRRVCMNVITSIVVMVGLYLFIWKQRIGDLIVWILETVFDMKHEAAFYYYSDHFRGNKEIFFAVAVLLIFTVLMVRIFQWVTGYFREVNQGIESSPETKAAAEALSLGKYCHSHSGRGCLCICVHIVWR